MDKPFFPGEHCAGCPDLSLVCRKRYRWWAKTSPCSSVPTDHPTSPRQRWQPPPPVNMGRPPRWAHVSPSRTGCHSPRPESPSRWSVTPTRWTGQGKDAGGGSRTGIFVMGVAQLFKSVSLAPFYVPHCPTWPGLPSLEAPGCPTLTCKPCSGVTEVWSGATSTDISWACAVPFLWLLIIFGYTMNSMSTVNLLCTPGERAHIKVNKMGIYCSLEQHHWSIKGCGVCDLTLHGSCQIQQLGQLFLLQR